MDLRSGLRTTEFWITLATIVALVADWATASTDGHWSLGFAALAAAAYAIARALVKRTPGGELRTFDAEQLSAQLAALLAHRGAVGGGTGTDSAGGLHAASARPVPPAGRNGSGQS